MWRGDVPLWQIAVVVLVVAWLAMMAVLLVIAVQRSIKRGRVRATGIRASARVEAMQGLGWRRNDNPGARLTLLVMPPDGSPYTATLEAAIPQLHIPRVQPGCQIPVAIDPKDRRTVVLDFDRG